MDSTTLISISKTVFRMGESRVSKSELLWATVAMILVFQLLSSNTHAVNSNSSYALGVNETLIDRLRFYLNSGLINWTGNYFSLIFGEQDKTDFEHHIDGLAENRDWKGVLEWSARCRKLGIEREEAIKWALGNITKVGELPESGIDGASRNYFIIYDRDMLFSTFYYSEKLDYAQDRWNKTAAYVFVKNAIAANSTYPATLYIYSDGQVGQGSNRYYDENAETISTYLIFYELGINEALLDAENVWNYVNSHHWNEETQHFDYSLTWPSFECEAAFFYKIACQLELSKSDIGNFTRVLTDAKARFLENGWSSPQWTRVAAEPGTSTYVVTHHYPGNSQRRLQNTLGAWFTLLGMYDYLDPSGQNDLRAMLQGSSPDLPPAWRLLYDLSALLYDDSSGMFRQMSDSPVSSYATSMALVLQALMGVTPLNATLAVPLEEYYYEYNCDIDPNFFRIDAVNNSLRIAVSKDGLIQFIYGEVPVLCDFPNEGVYQLDFSEDWNTILNVTRIADLPPETKLMSDALQSVNPEEKVHDIAVTSVLPLNNLVVQGGFLPINLTLQNVGDFEEDFNVTVRANSSTIASFSTFLRHNCSTTLTVSWNTTNIQKGEYVISAEAALIPGETISDNNLQYSANSVTVVSLGHDVAVTGLTVKIPETINVSVKNYGNFIEDVNLNVCANSSSIMSETFTLGIGESASASFRWNTSGWPNGVYQISAHADNLTDEDDTTDNDRTSGSIIVAKFDITGPDGSPDGIVEMRDIAFCSRLFWKNLSEPDYDPRCDFNGDGLIDMTDIASVAARFMCSY